MKKTSEAQSRAQKRYDKANTKGLYLKLNITTDEDILEHLDNIENKQGYIKELIRADMKSLGRRKYKGEVKMKKLQGIKLQGYKGTWSKIAETWYNGFKYYLFESDSLGDEVEGIVTNENLKPIASGYDDIVTLLDDWFNE